MKSLSWAIAGIAGAEGIHKIDPNVVHDIIKLLGEVVVLLGAFWQIIKKKE